MAVQYAPLFALETQFQAKNGRNLTGGFLRVFYAATDDPADTYSDYNLTRNPDRIVLDDNGRALVICDKSKAYRLEVYDADGMLLWTEEPVFCSGTGGGGVSSSTDIISTDGTIVVEKSTSGSSTTFDIGLGVDKDRLNPSCLRADATPRNSDGKFVFGELYKEGDLLSVDNYGCVRCEPACYHFTAIVELSYDQVAKNSSHQITLYTTLSNSVVDFDLSYAHRESIELSGDIYVVESNSEFVLGVTGLPNGVVASLVDFDIHAITGHGQSAKYSAGNGINIADHVISADLDVVQHKLTAGDNISITGNVISAGNFSQAQADWTEEDTGSPAYIRNKPDLGVYATKAEVNTGLATKQDTINDLAQIRAGAASGSSAVQPSDLAAVATTGDYNSLNNRPNLTVYATKTEVNTGLATKQDVISDLSAIRAGAQAGATAVQPADLDTYATKVELNTGLSGKQDTINDLSEIRSGAAAGATALQPSEVATVATTGDYNSLNNRPNLTVYATKTEVNTGLATKQDTISDLSTIRSGAAEGATAVQPGDLATVATTGSYDDLADKPTIPAAQVNSDWNSNSGVSQILNKPTLATVATTGDYDDLSNKPSIPAAQVNSDWNAVSGVSEILNKPTIPSGPQLVPAATPADEYKVLTVDPQGTPAWADAQAPILAGDGISISNNIVRAKVDGTTVTVNASGELQAAPAITVDQTYDATSTNAQSGTSVAQAIGSVDAVPNVTSSDSGKVLVANYSGGEGSYAWSSIPPANAIILDYSSTWADFHTPYSAGRKDIYYKHTSPYNPLNPRAELYLHLTAVSDVDGSSTNFTYALFEGAWDSDREYSARCKFRYSGKPLVYHTSWEADQSYSASSRMAQSGIAVSQAVEQAISSVNQVPESTSADADKVLTVNAQGTPEWATGGGSQVQSDWAEADSSASSYIENKPVPKTLTAGTGISIRENASTITISSSVTVPVRDVTVDGSSVVSNGVAAITMPTPPTIDQTYDASSTNAQSGVAVASGISAAIASSVMPISVVASLPANPDPNTLYVVTGA